MTNKVKAACKLAKTQFFEGKIKSENGSRTLFQLAKNIKDGPKSTKCCKIHPDKMNNYFVNLGKQLAQKNTEISTTLTWHGCLKV